jgi:hypothetical protein
MITDHSNCVHDTSRVVCVLLPTVIRAFFARSGCASSPHPAVLATTVKAAAPAIDRFCFDDLAT